MLTKNRSEKTEKKNYFDLKHLYHFSSDIKRNDLQFLNSKKKRWFILLVNFLIYINILV